MSALFPSRPDPCATCQDEACASGFGCPETAPLPCETVYDCPYSDHCEDGDLCAMILAAADTVDRLRLDLDKDCHDARELAAFLEAL